MLNIAKYGTALILMSSSLSTFASSAYTDDYIAVSAYFGGRYSDSLEDKNSDRSIDVENSLAQALSVSWYYGQNSEGELLYSHSKQNLDISDEAISTSIHTSYLHFGGRIHFVNNSPFSTNIGLGLGATFINPSDSEYDSDIFISGSITGGLRYQVSSQWALKADLRFYGTVFNSSSKIFCGDEGCLIELAGEIYMQTELMAGIEYKF